MNKVKIPTISIIMAVYNFQDTVAEAIDSILDQTFQDFEFIICDDCSSDNTYHIVCEYAERHPDKIVVLRNERNSKLAYSLNQCLQHVRGKYVARMDGDDVSVPERLQKQYDFLKANPGYDLVGTGIALFDEQGDWGRLVKKRIPQRKELLRGPCFNHATIMIKKSAYDRVGFYTDLPRTLRCEDVDLWFKFFAAGFQGYNMPDLLYRVRTNANEMKRRTLSSRLNGIRTMVAGYRLLKFPWPCYFCLMKQIIAVLVPSRVMLFYHKRVLR